MTSRFIMAGWTALAMWWGCATAGAQGTDVKALNAKLAPVIECINRVDLKMAANTRTYREIAAKAASDPNAKALPFFTFRIEPFETGNNFTLECASGLDRAVSAAPKIDDLDTTAHDYAATLRLLIPPMNEAEPYYAQHNYRDDKFAQGRALDVTLSPLLAKFATLSGELRAELARELVKVRRAELDAMVAGEGKTLHYWTLDLMLEGRLAIEEITGRSRAQQLTADVVEQAIAPLQAAFDGGAKQAAEHPDDAARFPLWASIQPVANSYLGAVKSLRRDLSAKAANATVNDDFRFAVQSFNTMVASYNALARPQ